MDDQYILFDSDNEDTPDQTYGIKEPQLPKRKQEPEPEQENINSKLDFLLTDLLSGLEEEEEETPVYTEPELPNTSTFQYVEQKELDKEEIKVQEVQTDTTEEEIDLMEFIKNEREKKDKRKEERLKKMKKDLEEKQKKEEKLRKDQYKDNERKYKKSKITKKNVEKKKDRLTKLKQELQGLEEEINEYELFEKEEETPKNKDKELADILKLLL